MIASTLLFLAATAIALGYLQFRTPEPGLKATVFRNVTFSGISIATSADRKLSVDDLATAAGLPEASPFSIDWSGWLLITQPGAYEYRLTVDDGAVVWIGDRAIVDVTGPPGIYERRGSVTLARGVHPVQIRYVQFLGDRQFKFQWLEPRNRTTLVTPTFFMPEAVPPTMTSVVLTRWLAMGVPLAWSAWIVLVLAGLLWKAGAIGRPRHSLSRREGAVGAAVLAACAGLALANITWGIFPFRLWHPEELTPPEILLAVEKGFSNGWWHLYPPFHFILTALVMSPTLLAERMQLVSFQDPSVLMSLQLTARLLSLVMAMVTLAVAWILGCETIGRSRAMIAVVFAGIAPLFTFYARTANVDMAYVMWVTVALLFYVRAAKYRRLGDFIRLGLAAALAIATKDQAYGFFAGPALALLWASWRHSRGTALGRIRQTVFDGRLWAGFAVFALAMVAAYGLPWNYEGVMAHVNYATGWRVSGFRMFDSDPEGRLRLFALTLGTVPWAMGVVPAVLSVYGAWAAFKRARRFTWLWWLMVPVVSYYLTLIMTIGYVYDRFLLGWLPIAALFAALGLDQIWRAPRLTSRTRLALASAGLIAAMVPAMYLNGEMAFFGTRNRLERWIAAHANEHSLIVATGNALYLPSLSGYRHVIVNTHTEDLINWNAGLMVINEDWLKRDDLPRARLVEILTRASYAEVHREETPQRPWWILAFTGLPPRPDVTNLLKVSPFYTVWQKQAGSP